MMTTQLPLLYTKIIGMMPKGAYKFATPAMVIAVCMQESGGNPIFTEDQPLFKDNLAAAVLITKLPEAMIIDALTIQQGPLKGEIAKFRCEPVYWSWSATKKLPSVSLRFLCSCSLGLGQQMMSYVLPANQEQWPSFIENFKSDITIQLKVVMEDLERLLFRTQGDLFRAYKGYNSGNPNSTNPDVIERAKRVVALRDKVQLQLQG